MKTLAVTLAKDLGRVVVLGVAGIAGLLALASMLGRSGYLALASIAFALALCACVGLWGLWELVRTRDRTRAQHQEHLHRRLLAVERTQQARGLMVTTHTRALVAACGCGRVVRCPDCTTKARMS